MRFLVEHFGAQRVAEIDPEPFYAFTDTRPRVSHPSPGRREPVWPRAEWYVIRMPEDVPHDLVLFTAPEPNLRWRSFTDSCWTSFSGWAPRRWSASGRCSRRSTTAPSRRCAAGRRPTRCARCCAGDRSAQAATRGRPGITTVLLAAARDRSLPAFSLSTSSPSYLTDMPNPRASAALLRVAGEIGAISFPLMDLEAESRVVAERVDQFLAERPELREAVDRLPYAAEQPIGRAALADEPPAELPSSAAVLQDLEEYLKSLRRENGGAASEN